MRIRRLLGLCLSLVIGLPAIAGAQDTPKTGIVIAYPSAFGILWHASHKVAIRPEFNVSGSSSKQSNAQVTGESSGWAVGFGLSALFYLHDQDSLRTYFVPRFQYSHASTSASSSINTAGTDVGSDIYGGSGSFGAQYGLGKRFALFGELGFEFDHRTTDSPTAGKISGNNWGLRSGVGVVFYP
jgi:hypothetical protein